MGIHTTQSNILKRLKRAHGHLDKVMNMIESHEGCLAVAQQLQAVVNAIIAAKTIHVQDHIEHCLTEALSNKGKNQKETIFEFKEIAKYL